LLDDLDDEDDHDRIDISIERFISMMIAYHCLLNEYNRTGNDEIRDFFYDFLPELEFDYQRCVCFIESKKYIDEKHPKMQPPLSIDALLNLVTEIGTEDAITHADDIPMLFHKYITERFTRFPETITPFLPFLSPEQQDGFKILCSDYGFFDEYEEWL
jgi:hypothetical protein